MDVLPHSDAPVTTASRRTEALRQASRQLEAQFLAEMFKSAGLNETSSFGGGVGEDQFRSFLSEAQAQQVVRAGGIGLAEAIFQSLVERDR